MGWGARWAYSAFLAEKALNGQYYIGLSIGHNATAALLRDGKVLACVSEERFTRSKNYAGFPERARRHFLEE